MLDRIRRYIDQHFLLPTGAPVVVGVSGGIDSVVLVHILHRLGFRVIGAHVNYRMRDDDSDEDERFVRRLCGELDIECVVRTVPAEFKEGLDGRSFQEAARDFRYAFFAETARDHEAGYVAVAHHLDDQAETVLMHLLRGSGIEGLAGMAPSRPLATGSDIRLIRPLLQVDRAEIHVFAEAHGLGWREDDSNAGAAYRRNEIRHELLARVRDLFGDSAIRNIARSAELARGYLEHTIEPELSNRFAAVSASSEEGGCLELDALRKQPTVWQTRLILEALQRWMPSVRYAASIAESVRELIDSQAGRRLVLPTGTVWRDREALVFACAEQEPAVPDADDVHVLAGAGEIALDDGRLRLSAETYRCGQPLDAGKNVCLVDADRIYAPFIVRRWQDGDRIRPFGMKGHKKVSDLLTDEKIPSSRRDRIRVVESDGEVVWVVGVRASEEGRVEDSARRLWRFEWVKNP